MSTKQDARIQKTKERLRAALLSLLWEKPLDLISISEICNNASINRNTFYSHYESVKDLQSEIEGLFMESLISSIKIDEESISSVSDIMRKILECVKANGDMCALFFTETGDKNFIKSVFLYALPSAVKNWSEQLNIKEEAATFLYYYILGGAVNVIEVWIKNGFKESVDEMSELLNGLILQGQSYFKNSAL